MPPPRSALLDRLPRAAARLACVATTVILAAGAPPASASAARAAPTPVLGGPLTAAPLLDAPSAEPADVEGAGEPLVCSGCTPPLTYHGGTIMGTPAQAGAVTVTPIFWAPSGFSFSPDYTAVVDQYVNDIAAASGTTKNVFAVNQEYSRAVSGVGGDQIQYQITANFPKPGGAPITDATAYPAATSTSATSPGCTPTAAFAAAHAGAKCVSDVAVQTELSKLIAANAPGKTGLAYFYPIFFPPNVDVVGSDGSHSDGDDGFCGIHGWYQSSLTNAVGPVVYSEEPYIIPECLKGQYPQYYAVAAYGQGAQDADSAVSTLSHELNESITDPGVANAPGWYDGSGHEIGDECSGIFGPPLGSTDTSSPDSAQASEFNQVINGHDYWTQETFSDATFAAFKTGQGCVQKAFRPQGSESPTQPTPDLGTGRVVASATSLPADGTSTSQITMTVSKEDGEPVVGDDVAFTVTPTEDGNAAGDGDCGTLSGGDSTTGAAKVDGDVGGMTDADGQITVTYTASDQPEMCDVIASEAEGGTSDATTIAQGADDAEAPSITAFDLPTSLTAGAAPVTFTTTESNPGSDDIDGALVTLILGGDDQGTTGLDSSQVDVSYADDSTGGQFVSVPLSGTTVDDGAINGDTQPETGFSLPAGASVTTTWRISLAAGVTASPAGVPLIIEADLNSIDPASGSETDLDYDNGTATVAAAPAVVPPTTTTSSTPTTITTTLVEPTQTIVKTVPGSPPTTVVQPTQTIVKTVPASAATARKCTVPKAIGDSLAAARAALKRAGCTSVTVVEPTHLRTQRLVVRTLSPRAGTKLPAGATITVALKAVAIAAARRT